MSSKRFMVTLKIDVAEKVIARATKENRSVSNLIAHLVEKSLKEGK